MNMKEDNEDELVRQKLLAKGAQGLTDAELLSIIIRNTSNGESALALSQSLLDRYNGNLSELAKTDISKIRMFGGMGVSRAAILSAALELGRRRHQSETAAIERFDTKDDVVKYFKPLIAELPYEEFWALNLGVSNRLLDKVKISQGGINGAVVDARLIVKRALDKLATSIIIVHNHPSGNCQPGHSDKILTEKLKNAVAFFDITLADHIIITSGECYSFRANGQL